MPRSNVNNDLNVEKKMGHVIQLLHQDNTSEVALWVLKSWVWLFWKFDFIGENMNIEYFLVYKTFY